MIPFEEYATRVQEHIETDYGIHIITRDVPDPFTGDLNGAEIHIDYAVKPEERLFLLAHLFGHTVQWNTSNVDLAMGGLRKPPVAGDQMPILLEYERDAARYALQLFHQIGITDADQWLSDYAACDEAYLMHFYRTGERKPFSTFWKSGCPIIEARKIPSFIPMKKTSRNDGIVI